MVKLRFFLWLLLTAAALFALGARWQSGPLLDANLLSMLPPDHRNPLAEQAVSRLLDKAGERAVILIGHENRETAREQAGQALRQMRHCDCFEQIQGEVGQLDLRKVLQPYAAWRFSMLSAEDREALRQQGGGALSMMLTRRLTMPGAGSIGLALEDDPFGLFNDVLMSLPLSGSKVQPDDGWLSAQGRGRYWVMLSARLKGAAGDAAAQRKAVATVLAIDRSARAKGGQLAATGAFLFADAARAQAEREMNLIAGVSLVGIVLAMWLVFRSLRYLALAALALTCGLAMATALTLACYGRLNVLTLVMGASLIGIAIDYPLQLFSYRLGLQNEAAGELFRKARPALALGLACALLGFGGLLWMPFPGLRQIALFCCTGLVWAWLTVFWAFPLLLGNAAAQRRRRAMVMASTVWRAHRRLAAGRRGAALLLAALLLAVPGLLRLQASDDVRLLVNSPERLRQDETLIRELVGLSGSQQFFLVTGADEAELLRRSHGLTKRLDSLRERGRLAGYQAVATFVPEPAAQRADRVLLRSALLAPTGARHLLTEAGMREALVDHYVRAAQEAPERAMTVSDWLAMPMSVPFRHLWLGKLGEGVATVVLPGSFASLADLTQAAQGLEGVVLVDKAASVSALFKEFRSAGVWLLALSFLFSRLVLWWRYGWQVAMRMSGLTLAMMALTLGGLGWLQVPFNLFAVLALLLVLGLGIDYLIFLQEGRGFLPAVWMGVMLSVWATLLSFGLLAFSTTPAVSAFGCTVAIGVAAMWFFSPLQIADEGVEQDDIPG